MSYPEAPAASDPAPARDRAAGDEDARLFLALWPDPALRARLCRRRDAWRWPPGARPVPDERLHLTLHYIGAFARRNVTALGNSLAAVSIEPTTLRALDEEVWRGGVAVLRLPC